MYFQFEGFNNDVYKCNISEQNIPARENKTCEGEIPRQSTNPSGDCYTILQTELIENIYDYWIVTF